jgi:fructose-1,6-bisphosphatase/inositol monophosphatase family enzyme
MSQYIGELAFAQSVARRAGTAMLRGFRTGISPETKADGTPVTRVDREVNQLVTDAVQAQRPGEAMLGEEDAHHAWATDSTTRPPRQWVCDPIDGTWLYAAGVPTNIFSLALLEDGRPVLGVLFDPYTDSMYHAVAGGGAILNGQPIRVNAAATISGSCFTLPGGNVDALNTTGLFADVIGDGADMVTTGSVIYDASLVALGFAAAHIYPYTSPWDMAAVKVIVEAAGGQVTDLYGHDQRYDQQIRGAIVTNGRLHDEVVELVGKHLR